MLKFRATPSRAVLACVIAFRMIPASEGGTAEPAAMSAARAPRLDRIFRNCGPWIGGDSADSVALGGKRILWLFGDSYLGTEEGEHRKILGMIRNAVAIQEGNAREHPHIGFFTGGSPGCPRAFFRPDGRQWVWPCRGGIRTASGLYVFLPEFRTVPGKRDGFGFEMKGMLLAKIRNPDDSPNRWNIRSFRVPSSVCNAVQGRSFGNPLRGNDGLIYLPGMEEVSGRRFLLMARTVSERLEDFGSWEYRSNTGWSRRSDAAVRLCDHVGAELSVSWKPFLGSYLMVTTENGLSSRIVGRAAPRPWGPWSNAVTLCRASESARDPALACYAGKEHPELAAHDDEIILSYVCNAEPRRVEDDPTLYRPRFVRVRLAPPRNS
jgi:hypothetical protein